ncbi:MAG: hypothetical protein F6K36_02125 [Symploca sp. SIO3C6]|uniref:Uncharacterized protein n=1 Tax=Symploca sp. SIO1C4 TaxID=2607765 RepID=A0A6B3NH27_9CYAN|nr:hypothetical protein [Symploca sp. SIO3C6]NER31027.1 hypothetical protein [Symploca sp. SIO1C4]
MGRGGDGETRRNNEMNHEQVIQQFQTRCDKNVALTPSPSPKVGRGEQMIAEKGLDEFANSIDYYTIQC